MANRSGQSGLSPLRIFLDRRRGALFFLAAVAVLFAGLGFNAWRVVPQDAFDTYQPTWECFIIGRMLKTARDGPFSAGGLNGLTGPDSAAPDIERPNYRFQYQAFADSLPFESYAAYESQTGGQGLLYGMLNALAPLAPPDRLAFFHGINALLSAVCLGLIFLWIYRELGLLPAATALAATALSQWLTLFARNLWWSLWAFYLPLILVGWYLSRVDWRRGLSLRTLALVVFGAVSVKCFFNGYEYITTALIMTAAPLAYYFVRERKGWKPFLAALAAAAAASAAAVVLNAAVLCLQVAAVEGTFARGAEHLFTTLLRRSYADPALFPADYAASLTAGPLEVVFTYLKGIYLDFNYYYRPPSDWIANFVFQFRYLYLIVLFAAATGVVLRRPPGADRRAAALSAALWFSLLAPLSWFVVFKAHSYVHTFLNNIVWQMPFTLLGFSVCGLALRAAVDFLKKPPRIESRKPAPAGPPGGTKET
jgi:hypothetical protein